MRIALLSMVLIGAVCGGGPDFGPSVHAQASQSSAPVLVFRLAKQTVSALDVVVSVGRIGVFAPDAIEREEAVSRLPNSSCSLWKQPLAAGGRTFQLGVTNRSAEKIELHLDGVGGALPTWQTSNARESLLSAQLGIGEERLLNVSFVGLVSEQVGQPAMVYLLSPDGLMATILIDYLALPDTVTMVYKSGPLPSGSGRNFSPKYSVVTGPAPFGYTLNRTCRALTGHRPACGTYSQCDDKQADDMNVTFEFAMQGEENRRTQNHS